MIHFSIITVVRNDLAGVIRTLCSVFSEVARDLMQMRAIP